MVTTHERPEWQIQSDQQLSCAATTWLVSCRSHSGSSGVEVEDQISIVIIIGSVDASSQHVPADGMRYRTSSVDHIFFLVVLYPAAVRLDRLLLIDYYRGLRERLY